MIMQPPRSTAQASCLARNGDWRREATHLRSLVDQAHLPPEARATLRREAEAADRQAGWWLHAAIEEVAT